MMSDSRTPKPWRRISLTHVGGKSDLQGDPAAAKELANIMAVDELDTRMHVHGFHTYPARLHPVTAERAVQAFSKQGDAVLDPFCGSGTVLVEARLKAREVFGSDLNPLAIKLAQLKTAVFTDRDLEELVDQAEATATHADERRTAKRGATKRYPEIDVELFDPHMLLELDGLMDGIRRVRDSRTREVLSLVVSSILIKVSRRRGDTSDGTQKKRLAAGFALRMFVAKTRELRERLTEVRSRTRDLQRLVTIQLCDARNLTYVKPKSIQLVITSPPYAGTYDYLDHHDARLRWLDLGRDVLAENEIGARRHVADRGAEGAIADFSSSLRDVLKSVHRALAPNGQAILVIADSVVAKSPVWAETIVRQEAAVAGLSWIATCSQERPHHHMGSRDAFHRRPRQEHAILLRKTTT